MIAPPPFRFFSCFTRIGLGVMPAGGLLGGREADSCGIVGVVGSPESKEDARGYLLEGLQVWQLVGTCP